MKNRYSYMISAVIVIVITLSLVGIGSHLYNKIFRKNTGPVLVFPDDKDSRNIIFFHHSTGKNIYNGGMTEWFEEYNSTNSTDYSIYEQIFPKIRPYGWKNYPYDYWNIWVKNQNREEYYREPTLELITQYYDVVVLKHCFPVSGILEDDGNPDVSSDKKTLANYRLQYGALLDIFHRYNETKFIIWTTPALVEQQTNKEEALRAREFNNWTINEWDRAGDNVFIWDFYGLETEGGLYMKEQYAKSPDDPHPNEEFSGFAAPLLCNRIVEIIEGRGDDSTLTGK